MTGRLFGAAFAALFASNCALAAGLGDFELANDAASTGTGAGETGGGGGGTGGEAGAGGAVVCTATDVVISEARTVGSNGATDDLVELYNPTASPISLAGYTVTARAPTSMMGSDFERFIGTAADVIPPYGHLLIAGASFDDGLIPDQALGVGESFGNEVLVFLNKNAQRIDVLCICADLCADTSKWGECGGVLVPNPATLMPADISVHREPACVDTDAPVDFTSGPSSPMNLSSPTTQP